MSGTHDGYSRLPDPAAHVRNILFLKRDYWIIQDEVSSRQKHHSQFWLHFDAGIRADIGPDQSGNLKISEVGLDIQLFAPTGGWNAENGWISNCYGSKEAAAAFVFSTDAPEMVTFLLPRVVAADPETIVKALETIGGTGFELTHPDGVDVVMLKDKSSAQVETARLASDFSWTWARFSKHDETSPTELLLMSGTTLHLQGKRVLRTSTPLEYLVARRVEDQFTVESDHGVMDLRLPASDFASAFSRLSDSEVSN